MSRPWIPPLIVFALVVVIAGAFVVAGPQLGLAVGTAAVAALVVGAARAQDKGTIKTAEPPDLRRRVLVVLFTELDERAVEEIRRAGEFDRPGNTAEVLLVAPAFQGALDRWAADVGRAREAAQRKLVVSAAALGKADIVTRSSVGDADPVLAVEDVLWEFAASEVIAVTGKPGRSREVDKIVRELETRLDQPLSRVIASEGRA